MERLFGKIPSIIDGLGADPEAKSALVVASWQHIAGEDLRARTRAMDYSRGRLYVGVADTSWKTNLEALASTMVAKLNELLGDGTVHFIEFRVVGQLRNEHPAKSPNSDEVPPGLVNAAAVISDPILRESFLNAASEYLRKRG